MTKKKKTGPTAERFVEVTLSLIVEKGGSLDVNLRQVARGVGCAHTNVYNYYADFQDLLWEAFRRALIVYGEYITYDLDDSLPPMEYFRRVISNLATFPQDNPGLYRFIGSDPINLDEIPADIMDTVVSMKVWLFEVVKVLCGPEISADTAEEIANIILAYIDGETFNIINGRTVPGEDVPGRIMTNALRLFTLLTQDVGVDLTQDPVPRSFPRMNLEKPTDA